MTTLRDIIDGKAIENIPALLAATKASPLTNHVSRHVQDPVGATKDQFGKLQQKKLEYDMAREETQRNLAPVQSVISHLSTLHNLQPNQQPMLDQNGQNPDEAQGYDENGNPINTQQQPGQTMNQSRPSLVGHQPGVAPGPSAQVVPPKMGVPKPGQGNASTRAGNPGQSIKPPAKALGQGGKGKGNSQKSKAGTGRPINVTVHGSSSSIPVIHGSSTIDTQFGIAKLNAAADMGENDLRSQLQECIQKKYHKGGDSSSPKAVSGPYPYITDVFPYKKYFVYSCDGKTFKQEYELEDNEVSLVGDPEKVKIQYVAAAGTSVGAKKNWSTRNKGHISSKEKKAQHDSMDAMMPGNMGRITTPNGSSMRSTHPMPISPSPVRGQKMFAKKKMKAGPAALSDKVDDTENQIAYNPVVRGKGKTIKVCTKCGALHADGEKCMKANRRA
jgi:hypothetical protein